MTSTPSTPEPIDRGGRPRLRRLRTGTMLGGVCGGLAEYTGIDVVLWRVAFLALTLAGGAGLLAYLLLWVALPAAPLEPGQRPTRLDPLVERLHIGLTEALTRSRR